MVVVQVDLGQVIAWPCQAGGFFGAILFARVVELVVFNGQLGQPRICNSLF